MDPGIFKGVLIRKIKFKGGGRGEGRREGKWDKTANFSKEIGRNKDKTKSKGVAAVPTANSLNPPLVS